MRSPFGMIATLPVTCVAVPKAEAEPLVTISCDKPNGFNIAYRTTITERFDARQKKPTGTSAETNGTQ
jgi:hypothetical protein